MAYSRRKEVCRRYQAQGYDFIALTDHLVGRFDYPITDTTAFRNDRFTTLLGAELHSGAMSNGEIWHILAVGLPADFERPVAPDFKPHPEQETGPELARRAVKPGRSSLLPILNGHNCLLMMRACLMRPIRSRSTITAAPPVAIADPVCTFMNTF